MTKISVIILNYKTPKMTCDCIRSLIEKNIDISYEIVVVDNNSGDDSKNYFDSILSTFKNIKIIYSIKNSGFGVGNNIGAKNSNGEYLLFLNSDTLFYENSLKLLFDVYQKISNDHRVGFIQPRLYLDKEKKNVQQTCAKIPKLIDLIQENISLFQKIRRNEYNQFRYLDWDRNSSRFVDVVCGAAMFCKKDFFETIGHFDQRFFLYFEEYDICRRARIKGYENRYSIETGLIHLYNKSPSPSMNKKMIYISSFLKYIIKNY